jgi:hypothetical protein
MAAQIRPQPYRLAGYCYRKLMPIYLKNQHLLLKPRRLYFYSTLRDAGLLTRLFHQASCAARKFSIHPFHSISLIYIWAHKQSP